ncbi:MAG: large repetitive protein [Pseudonocardiales bacterium]|jgi:uncharacterized repeat protein (TIGR01451 family)|nr:large repetitive protein [Pseudonocardiales bacterium]
MKLLGMTGRRLTTVLTGAVLAMSAAVVVLPASAQAAAPASGCQQPVSVNGSAVPHIVCPKVKGVSARAAASSFGAQNPAPIPGNDMTNHGGNIMKAAQVYNVFWLPAGTHFESPGSATTDTNYENLLNRFFQDVGNSDLMQLMRQYPGANGTPNLSPMNRLAGSYVDTTAYPHAGTAADPLTDGDIRAATTRAATTNSWAQDTDHIYMIYTAFGIDECFGANNCNYPSNPTIPNPLNGWNYCAYHSYFNTSTIYAFMGDDASEAYGTGSCAIGSAPNGDAAADSEISTASHEYFEAQTDPQLDGWYHTNLSGEIGDLCAYDTGPTNSIGANLYLNSDPYIVQREWSNAIHTCSLDMNAALTSDVPPTLTATKTGPSTLVSGQTFTYTITVNNPSGTNASSLTKISDPLPSGISYVSGSSTPAPTSTSPLTWNLGTIAVHDTATITFQARTSTPASINNCTALDYWDEYELQHITASGGCAASTVSKGATSTTVSGSPNPSVYGQTVTLTANVSPQAPATGTPTGTVAFTDGATPLGSAPVVGGTATLTISTLSVGSHAIGAGYSGDGSFLTSSNSFTQVVNKAPTSTSVVCVPPAPHVNQAVTCTATVTPTGAPGPQPPTGTVSFYIDGSATPFATVPLTGNHASIVTTFGGGAHSVVATYNGDANYLASTSAAMTVTVACDQTITGVHSSLIVTSGTTCVLNATITGGISVANGAVLDVENSTVNGSISANAPGGLRICGSHTGTITVSKATGFVLIGDPANNCAPNTVAGSILASNNTGGLVIVGNTVSGTVTATGNSGAGPLPGETGPIVSGNHH